MTGDKAAYSISFFNSAQYRSEHRHHTEGFGLRGGMGAHREVGRTYRSLSEVRNCSVRDRAHNVPNGISISSAMPSIPIRVIATTVTTGIIFHLQGCDKNPEQNNEMTHPSSFTSVNGSAKRYKVTHCFK